MRIGITGSIACGKSTVSAHLRELGYTVIDADQISHSLTARDGAAIPMIKAAFPECFTADGEMDRKALGQKVFENSAAKQQLEGILHPLILSTIREQLQLSDDGNKPVFADIPLLFECGMERDFDQIWTVTVDEETQIERICNRDSVTREDAIARIRAQMSQAEKMQRANQCIPTDGTPEETGKRVDLLLASLTPTPTPSIPKRRVRSVPIETQHEDRPRSRSASNPSKRKRKPQRTLSTSFASLPRQAKILIVAIGAFLVLFSSVTITRSFMARQAERQRLEAEAAEKAMHPLRYGDLVLSYSAREDLDPALVAAVILCESSYNPEAESRLGARGLMQLMEDTASWVAHRLGEDTPDYTFDLLYDPETNIRFGTWYLGFLSRRYNGDAKKIVCAYHAGQGNVDSWLKNPDYSPDGVTLDTIPTKDTAAYASKVLRARDIYEKYYFPKPTPEPESTEIQQIRSSARMTF